MFEKILVAVDYSDFSRHILELAIVLAAKMRSQLTLLHVITERDPDRPDNHILNHLDFMRAEPSLYSEVVHRYHQQWQEYVNRNLEMLQSFAREVEAEGISVNTHYCFGEPGPMICETAQDLLADTIVMGRRGHRGISELFLGSTSNYVLHHAPCSVLVIPQSSDNRMRSTLKQQSTATR